MKTRAQVVDDIAHGRAQYYTDESALAPRAYLEVQTGLFGVMYVRTEPDCATLNNLLSLPRF